jgi:hypothetical protein
MVEAVSRGSGTHHAGRMIPAKPIIASPLNFHRAPITASRLSPGEAVISTVRKPITSLSAMAPPSRSLASMAYPDPPTVDPHNRSWCRSHAIENGRPSSSRPFGIQSR